MGYVIKHKHLIRLSQMNNLHAYVRHCRNSAFGVLLGIAWSPCVVAQDLQAVDSNESTLEASSDPQAEALAEHRRAAFEAFRKGDRSNAVAAIAEAAKARRDDSVDDEGIDRETLVVICMLNNVRDEAGTHAALEQAALRLQNRARKSEIRARGLASLADLHLRLFGDVDSAEKAAQDSLSLDSGNAQAKEVLQKVEARRAMWDRIAKENAELRRRKAAEASAAQGGAQ